MVRQHAHLDHPPLCPPDSLQIPSPWQLRLHIPATLKTIIMQDYEQVTQAGQLLPLPRSAHYRPTVHQILEEYQAHSAAELEAEDEDKDSLDRSREERVAALKEVGGEGVDGSGCARAGALCLRTPGPTSLAPSTPARRRRV